MYGFCMGECLSRRRGGIDWERGARDPGASGQDANPAPTRPPGIVFNPCRTRGGNSDGGSGGRAIGGTIGLPAQSLE